jgi:hypothetical protein
MSRPDTSAFVAIGRTVGAVVRDHAALLFLLVTTLGATYEFFFYLRFRVNILQFAEPLDFLFAAIRQPLVILFSVLPLPFLFFLKSSEQVLRRWFAGYDRMSRSMETRPMYAWLTAATNVVFVIVYFVLFTVLFSKLEARQIYRGGGRKVVITVAANPAPLRGTLLGTTGKYVFLFVPADTSTHVIPLEGMAEMVVLRRARPASAATEPALAR